MPSLWSLRAVCYIPTSQQLTPSSPLLKDPQLFGEDTQVWKDSLMHPLVTLILLSESVNLHKKKPLITHIHN